jgi:hypothetical protein
LMTDSKDLSIFKGLELVSLNFLCQLHRPTVAIILTFKEIDYLLY